MVALSLFCWSIYLCFRYFDRFCTLSCNFHPASWNFPHSIPLIFLNFPPSINPLLHALKTELFFPPRAYCSATHLFVHFQKYLRTPKQYSSIQQRILAWTNSSRRSRRHVWCWVEFHPNHCLRGEEGIVTAAYVGHVHQLCICIFMRIYLLVVNNDSWWWSHENTLNYNRYITNNICIDTSWHYEPRVQTIYVID